MFTYSPELAVGTLWALRVKNGKSCTDARADTKLLEEVPLGRFVESDPAKCRINHGGDHKSYTFRVEEKAAANVGVGAFVDAKAQGARAFEVQIAKPASASFENEEACLPISAILKLKITADMGFCAMRWSRAAVLTTVTWRSFAHVDADIKGAYVIVKVGGELYSSTEEMKETPILSGNYTDLIGRIPSDKNGTLDFTLSPPDKNKPDDTKKVEWPLKAPAAILPPTDPVFAGVKGNPRFRAFYLP